MAFFGSEILNTVIFTLGIKLLIKQVKFSKDEQIHYVDLLSRGGKLSRTKQLIEWPNNPSKFGWGALPSAFRKRFTREFLLFIIRQINYSRRIMGDTEAGVFVNEAG